MTPARQVMHFLCAMLFASVVSSHGSVEEAHAITEQVLSTGVKIADFHVGDLSSPLQNTTEGGDTLMLMHDSERVNTNQHFQPFARHLLCSFTLFGVRYAFDMLVADNLFAAKTTLDFVGWNGEVTREMPSITSYAGHHADGHVLHATIHLRDVVGDGDKTVAANSRAVTKGLKQVVVHALLHTHAGDVVQIDHMVRVVSIRNKGKAPSDMQQLERATGYLAMYHHQAGQEEERAMGGETGDSVIPSAVKRSLLASVVAAKWKDCYVNDDKPHDFNLALAFDNSMYEHLLDMEAYYRIKPMEKMAEWIHDANLVYSKQLNIWFKVSTTNIQTTSDDSNGWNEKKSFFGGCPSGTEAEDKLKKFTAWQVKAPQNMQGGIWHLFTGCPLQNLGIAYVNQMCTNLAVSLTMNAGDLQWRWFAHEVGHNFGANHSFEKGEKQTGGIMDYGDGKFMGTYLFLNYRKTEMCNAISSVLNRRFSWGPKRPCFEDRREVAQYFKVQVPDAGSTDWFFVNVADIADTTWTLPAGSVEVPSGTNSILVEWRELRDAASGNLYYEHLTDPKHTTQWEKPPTNEICIPEVHPV